MASGPDNSLEWGTLSPKFHESLDGHVPLRVVSVGSEDGLLKLREQVIIAGTGLEVRSLLPEDAEELAHSSESMVWIFCSTVMLGPLVYLASAVRRYSPESRLVLLEGTQPLGYEVALFHRILDPIRDVELLIETIRELADGAQ